MTGTELRTIRLAHGLSQRALAELLGYHAKHIQRLEHGREGVRITERCCKLLKSLLAEKRIKKNAARPCAP